MVIPAFLKNRRNIFPIAAYNNTVISLRKKGNRDTKIDKHNIMWYNRIVFLYIVVIH